MSHELGTYESWQAVMHDLCRWTSKERQQELARNETRIALERRQNVTDRGGTRDARRTWNVLRSASRRGVVKGVKDRKDFSWASVEAEERRYEGIWRSPEEIDDYIDRLAADINWQSRTAGK